MRSTKILRCLFRLPEKIHTPRYFSSLNTLKTGFQNTNWVPSQHFSVQGRFFTSSALSSKDAYHNENMLNIYKRLDAVVGREVLEAKKLNKKLILLAGDKHGERGALVLQIMLMQSAHRHGIHQVLAEIPPGASQFIDELVESENDEDCPNLAYSLQLARNKLGMKITEADVDLDSIANTIEDIVVKRNKNFAEKCLQVKQNSLFVMGVGHLHGVLTHPLLSDKTHHVVALNLEGKPSLEVSATCDLMKSLHELAKPSRDASIIEQFHVPSIDWDSFDPREIVQQVEKIPSMSSDSIPSLPSYKI